MSEVVDAAAAVAILFVVYGAIAVMMAGPDIVEAWARGRGRRSTRPVECVDCGDRLRGRDGSTCRECKGIRRAAVARVAEERAAREGDNAS